MMKNINVAGRVAQTKPLSETMFEEENFDCTLKEEENNIFFSEEQTENLSTKKSSKEKRYTCEYCPQSFLQLSNLKRHQKMHTGERPYICDQCNKTFSTYSNLRQHEQVHQESDNRKRFCCEYCPRSYYYHSSLKKHVKAHQSRHVISTETSHTMESQNYHELEPGVRKQVHTQRFKDDGMIIQNRDLLEPENSITCNNSCPKILSEPTCDKNKTTIDSPAVALTLSLLTQKLDLLRKLHELKAVQLQTLQKSLSETKKFGDNKTEKVERQEEERILIQMLSQVAKNCSLALSQPEISQRLTSNPKTISLKTKLNLESTEPSQGSTTPISKLNNLSGSVTPRSIDTIQNQSTASPSTLIPSLDSLVKFHSDEKNGDHTSVNNLHYKSDESLDSISYFDCKSNNSQKKINKTLKPFSMDCDPLFWGFNYQKLALLYTEDSNQMEILHPLIDSERDRSELLKFSGPKGTDFNYESLFSLNFAS